MQSAKRKVENQIINLGLGESLNLSEIHFFLNVPRRTSGHRCVSFTFVKQQLGVVACSVGRIRKFSGLMCEGGSQTSETLQWIPE